MKYIKADSTECEAESCPFRHTSKARTVGSGTRVDSRSHDVMTALFLLTWITIVGAAGCYSGSVRNSNSSSPASTANPGSSRVNNPPSADQEFKKLQERRISASPSEGGEIIEAFSEVEKKYPNDYRFPYERAKLSIKGIVSHHEAFNALFLAGEKAIANGKAQEMLDSLTSDKEGDFYKLAKGHHEWTALEEALRKKDKTALNTLHH